MIKFWKALTFCNAWYISRPRNWMNPIGTPREMDRDNRTWLLASRLVVAQMVLFHFPNDLPQPTTNQPTIPTLEIVQYNNFPCFETIWIHTKWKHFFVSPILTGCYALAEIYLPYIRHADQKQDGHLQNSLFNYLIMRPPIASASHLKSNRSEWLMNWRRKLRAWRWALESKNQSHLLIHNTLLLSWWTVAECSDRSAWEEDWTLQCLQEELDGATSASHHQLVKI